METGKQIIDAAIKNGATLAGIANVQALRKSSSHLLYSKMGDYKGVGTVDNDNISGHELFNWPESAVSILVIGLSHPKDQPELDWWDGSGTPGNRRLIDIIKRTRQYIENDMKLKAGKAHYYVEKGGVFLKDAAVLAGLGCIGKNNMLVTPTYGPKIRLRGLFLDVEITPTGPIDFDPCADCKVYCRMVCPVNAMDVKMPFFESVNDTLGLPARDGSYDRETCNIRMEKDISESRKKGSAKNAPVKYCRRCEFICPAGKNHQ